MQKASNLHMICAAAESGVPRYLHQPQMPQMPPIEREKSVKSVKSVVMGCISVAECEVLCNSALINIFAALRRQVIGPLMRHRRLVDTRGCLKPQEWVAEGFQVTILGDGKAEEQGCRGAEE